MTARRIKKQVPGGEKLFQRIYTRLGCEGRPPAFVVEFHPYTDLTHTIRLRQGRLLVRLSDLLEGAPDAVLRAIAHILLAKIYRHPIDRAQAARYRKYVASHDIVRQTHLVRQLRGRKRLRPARGHFYDLDSIFEQLNTRFFHGLMARPRMSWSQTKTRRILGHYDPAHNAIIISRIFDHPAVPAFVLDYIVYHEMLHLKHPVRLRGSRRCVHSAEFHAEEKLFPHITEANAFLKRM